MTQSEYLPIISSPYFLENQDSLLEAIQYLRSDEYSQRLSNKNLPAYLMTGEVRLTHNPEVLKLLTDRTGDLIRQSFLSLSQFYGDTGDIGIPFSGGRDSSSLALLTTAFFPERKTFLLTVLNGFECQPGNARIQADSLNKQLYRLGIQANLTHVYIDLADTYGTFVVKPAWEDRLQLGYPGLCSSCKILMEDGLAQVAQAQGLKHIPMGYTENQAQQQWPEQNQAQITTMRAYLREKYPELHFGQPLWNVYRLPLDSTLVLAAFGLSPKKHKNEMGCVAGGLNPKLIDPGILREFVGSKLEQLPRTRIQLESIVPDNSASRYEEEIDSLRNNHTFIQTVY